TRWPRDWSSDVCSSDLHWIDFIRIAPIHVGGITEARKICVLADTYFVRTAFHGASDLGPIGQAAAVHLDLAIPNFGVQEWMNFQIGRASCRERVEIVVG